MISVNKSHINVSTLASLCLTELKTEPQLVKSWALSHFWDDVATWAFSQLCTPVPTELDSV